MGTKHWGWVGSKQKAGLKNLSTLTKDLRTHHQSPGEEMGGAENNVERAGAGVSQFKERNKQTSLKDEVQSQGR